MYSIENSFLKIVIHQKGAELISLFNKETNTEILWQGDPDFWTGQSPLLFPIVGELKDGFYLYNNKKYKIPRHGLVRKSTEWQIEIKSDSVIECTFVSNNTTRSIFPFEFKLMVSYQLHKKSLNVTYYVANNDNLQIPISIGAHPAFNCPINNKTKLGDYYLEFEKTENSNRYLITDKGLLSNKTIPCLQNTNKLHLSDTLFNEDALVFKDLKSQKINLVGPSGKILSVNYPNFPFMGIWSKPKAPYVCIEPWIGHADTVNSNHNLFNKDGSISLKPNQNFTANYQIEIA